MATIATYPLSTVSGYQRSGHAVCMCLCDSVDVSHISITKSSSIQHLLQVAILQATTVRNKPQEAGHTPFATPLSSAAQFQQVGLKMMNPV